MNHEQHQPLPAFASLRQLRLLCLLVPSSVAVARSIPVCTMWPMPPLVFGNGRWCLEGDPCLSLRETHAAAPTPEVLERCVRQRKPHAIHTDAGARA